MDLLFLGTSSGTPTRARNVSGLALLEDTSKGWYLIDCGEGTQHRLLRTPLSLHRLRAIFITHVHGDHCFGLPGLLASAGMMGRKAPLEIIAPEGIEAWIRATLQMSQSWLGYELIFRAVESLGEWCSLNMRVEAIALSHRVPCYGYRFTEARPDPRLNIDRLERDGIPRGPLWGQLARGVDVECEGRTLRSDDYLNFTRPPRRIVVGGDNDRPELLADACQAAHVLIHEANLYRGRRQHQRQHLRAQHRRPGSRLCPASRRTQSAADALQRTLSAGPTTRPFHRRRTPGSSRALPGTTVPGVRLPATALRQGWSFATGRNALIRSGTDHYSPPGRVKTHAPHRAHTPVHTFTFFCSAHKALDPVTASGCSLCVSDCRGLTHGRMLRW